MKNNTDKKKSNIDLNSIIRPTNTDKNIYDSRTLIYTNKPMESDVVIDISDADKTAVNAADNKCNAIINN